MKKLLGIVLALLFALKVYAGEITVYAAADLTYAFDELLKVYKQKYPQDKVKAIFGSSGKGFSQVVNGAPYDVFFSADMGYVEKLKQQGLTLSDVKLYAIGRIVLWTRKDSGIDVSKGINVVLDPKVKKIAIANWEHAPYGVAAKECLEYYKLFDKVKSRLVLGENINQTAQYIETGAADVGFIALSIAKSEKLQKVGTYYLLPANCHSQIKQGYAILKHANTDKETFETAKRFYDFIATPEARKIFIKYGFVLPGEE
ncbi:molybdate ABC transporter substrate-binding protein [Sulfurihydrogenibium subterraneum]|uniref:molybdate ABC transporter substrate-binding protein n=1 Tax=Sulfurihydrogenibium subterraneum TaxID=171121 RepID=UPI0004900E81|nr:molybdate ABC transporter substrate-binding protein [Sulfurihydrogenibium subterraneum]